MTLAEIQYALHAELDRFKDPEVRGGVTIAITDPETGDVYGFDTDSMTPQAALELIDAAQRPFDLFHPDCQGSSFREEPTERTAR